MTPECETSQDVEVADGNGGKHTIKVVIPRTRLHGAQFWGIIGGMLGAAGIVAALLAAFFMSKTEAALAHGAINQKVGEHVVVDDLRDGAIEKDQTKIERELKAVQHNLMQIGGRVRADDLKTADDFDIGDSP